MTVFQELLNKIHRGKDPYAGFPAHEWSGVWFNDPGAQREIFYKCIQRLKPTIIVEVGSFVGESAVHMAKYTKAPIVCVDTWYAGVDHWKGAPEKINMHFGRPDLFYRFMANVIQHNCQDVIVPLASDSINGARILKHLGITPQLVYVDASHEEGDVLRDYSNYWDLLPPGGGMLVDDLSNHFPGVLHDFDLFTRTLNLTPVLAEGEKALIIKP